MASLAIYPIYFLGGAACLRLNKSPPIARASADRKAPAARPPAIAAVDRFADQHSLLS